MLRTLRVGPSTGRNPKIRAIHLRVHDIHMFSMGLVTVYVDFARIPFNSSHQS